MNDVDLLRRYEPVLRYTEGELFLPMRVEDYVAACSLWTADSDGDPRHPLVPEGAVSMDRLVELGAASAGTGLSLRYVAAPLTRARYRAWRRRPDRPRFHPGVGRFVTVGLVGRLIDAGLRLSLLVRGRVPGGTAAAAQVAYATATVTDPTTAHYYGRVVRDCGYTVLQYWYFYAMNDWRSTFGGINDHEADWEQVTLFLADPPGDERPAWTAFSSHDAVGDDLRRRSDDPDIEWAGRHPVVYAGAGSHSGAYLPGDYLVTVEPPALQRLVGGVRRIGRLLLPWTRDQSPTAVGIPFVDYHRGDGPGVGAGQGSAWSATVIDDDTPWVRDYRGLWGLETGDPFGGERAPAGPRYERDGSIRLSWSDPVGWAGLDKEPPSAAARARAVEERLAALSGQIADISASIDSDGSLLRQAALGLQSLGPAARADDQERVAALDAHVGAARQHRAGLAAEREALLRDARTGRVVDPHAHLRRRAVPGVDTLRTRRRVLQAWSAVSASVALVGLAVIVLGRFGPIGVPVAVLALVMLSVEAFARRTLVQFIAGLLAVAVVGLVVWLAVYAVLYNWRVAVASVLVAAAVVLLLANVRAFFRRR